MNLINSPRERQEFSLYKTFEDALTKLTKSNETLGRLQAYIKNTYHLILTRGFIESMIVSLPLPFSKPTKTSNVYSYFYPKHRATLKPEHREGFICKKCGDEVIVYRHTKRNGGLSIQYSTYHPQPLKECTCGLFSVGVCKKGLIRLYTDSEEYVQMFTPIKFSTHVHKAPLGFSLKEAPTISVPRQFIDGKKFTYRQYTEWKKRSKKYPQFSVYTNHINLVQLFTDAFKNITFSQEELLGIHSTMPLPVQYKDRAKYYREYARTYNICIYHRNEFGHILFTTPELTVLLGANPQAIQKYFNKINVGINARYFVNSIVSKSQRDGIPLVNAKHTELLRQALLEYYPHTTIEYVYPLNYFFKPLIGYLPYMKLKDIPAYQIVADSFVGITDPAYAQVRSTLTMYKSHMYKLLTILSTKEYNHKTFTNTYLDYFRNRAKLTHQLPMVSSRRIITVPRYVHPNRRTEYITYGSIKLSSFYTRDNPKVKLDNNLLYPKDNPHLKTYIY